jgi:hypothetical protein
MTKQKQPEILALCDLQVHVAQGVRTHLTRQFEADHGEKAAEHFDRILEAMKRPPKQSVVRVNQLLSNAREVQADLQAYLDNWLVQNDAKDSYNALVSVHPVFADVVTAEIVVANTLQQTHQQSTTGFYSRHSLPPREAYEHIFLDWPIREQAGWPVTHRVVICDRRCAEAVLCGSDIFVPGILAADAGIRIGEQVAVYGDVRSTAFIDFPRGLVVEEYAGRCVFLGVGMSACPRSDYFRLSKGVGVRMRLAERCGPILPPFSNALASKSYLQNLPSIVVGHTLQAKPGHVILDMCAAPGGKALHIASIVNNNATIIACDRSHKKMVTAKALFMKHGATCIIPVTMDSTDCAERSEQPRLMTPSEVRIRCYVEIYLGHNLLAYIRMRRQIY